jgi:molybdenum cofactor biosynthesis protein B
MSWKDHHTDLPKEIRFLLITTSDTIVASRARGVACQDVSGELAESLVKGAGYLVAGRLCLANSVEEIRNEIRNLVSSGSADVVVVSGGTGPGPHDLTIEAISPLIDKPLPGFGELFRRLSYETVGISSIASRSMAGVSKKALIFALPGSPDAVRLALERIILPESQHLLKMVQG